MNLLLRITDNKATVFGWASLIAPSLFWLALFIEQAFGKPLVSQVFGNFYTVPSVMLFLVLVAMPAIGLLFNLMTIFNFNITKGDDEWITEVRLKLLPNNILLVLLTGANVVLLVGYAMLTAGTHYYGLGY